MFQNKTRLLSFKRIAAFALLLFFIAKPALAALPHQISVSLAAEQSQYSAEDGLTIAVTYRNRSVEAVRFLKWGTALEKTISHDIFSVVYEGNSLPYIGRHYKRAAATEDDYVTIAPLASITRVVDLESLYPMNYSGEYAVEYREHNHQHLKDSNQASELHQVVTLNLKADRPIRFQKIPPNFQNCNSGDLAAIDRALGDAELIARVARDSLRNTPINSRGNAERYRRWFGVYASDRWDRVQSNFDLIYDAAANRQINFICDYDESAFAYVFSGQPYDIYLGQAFFAAPANGTDSKSGVIVHELSHFLILGGTNRFSVHPEVYGTSSNLALARSNPEHASWNAESHEYFAENTPFFSMPAPVSNQPAGPDFDFSSISLSKESPTKGSQVEVAGTVSNESEVSVGSVVLTAFISAQASIADTDQSIGTVSIGSLGSNASRSFVIDARIPDEAGQRFIGVCATATSSEGAKQACSVGVAVDVLDRIAIAPIIKLLLGD